MGACFHTEVFDGKLTPKELEKAYNDRVESLRDEYGSNAYNGTFSTLHGIKVDTAVFETQREADDYLHNVCEKRSNAVAIRYKDRREETTKEPTFEGKLSKEYNYPVIIFGGSDGLYSLRCAVVVLAAPDYKRKPIFADQLTPAQKNQFVTVYESWHAKHAAERGEEDTFRAALNLISTTREPITTEMLKPLKVAGNQRHKLRKTADAEATRLKAVDKKFAEKLYTTTTVDHGTQWLVGGLCAE